MPGNRVIKKAAFEKDFVNDKFVSKDCKLSLNFIITEDFHFLFHVDEHTHIGSQILISVFSDFNKITEQRHFSFERYTDLYLVRDIPIEDKTYGFYRLPYFALRWNLLNPESDKILNIARSKLIKPTRNKHNEVLVNDIFPEVIPLMWTAATKCLRDNPTHVAKERLLTVLFHIRATALIYDLTLNADNNFQLADSVFPSHLIFYNDSTAQVLIKDFFEIDSFLVIRPNYFKQGKEGYLDSVHNTKEKIIDFGKKHGIKATITNPDYLQTYLQTVYALYGYDIIPINEKDKLEVFMFCRKGHSNEQRFECSENTRKEILRSIAMNKTSRRRAWIYPIKPYSENLSVKNSFATGFEWFPTFSQTSIISPFCNIEEMEQLRGKLSHLFQPEKRELLIQTILSNHVTYLISDKMIDWIIAHNANSNIIDRATILKSYSELMADYYLLE